ncbi:hypothetical protein ACSBR1_032101 [Camellia fascicularis]
MVADTGVLLRQHSVSVLDLDVQNFLDVSSATPPPKPPSESVSVEISCVESVASCKNGIRTTVIESSSASKFVPSIRSGSHTDIGCRKINEDEHICIDDLSAHLGYLFGCRLSSAFYAVFDGHGGSNAAAVFVKENAMKLFFEDANLPQTSEIDDLFLEQLESCHRKAFLLADQALAGECSSVPVYCGTTAITALILGRHLMVANAGDCRAVLCRKGVAVQMSHDHRPSYPPERKRVEELGGYIKYDCLNGDLAVTRALGDWDMKPLGSASPLTAEPEVQQRMLTEDDEFLIVACDGIWDVMSNDEAVNLVHLALKCHDDPQQCAKELVNEALRRSKDDNLTAIVVCFTPPICQPQRPRLRCCCLSEEGMNRLRTSLEGN